MANINATSIGNYPADFLEAFLRPESYRKMYKVPPMFFEALADAYDMRGITQMHIKTDGVKRTWVQINNGPVCTVVALDDNGKLCGSVRNKAGAFQKVNFVEDPQVCKAIWLLMMFTLDKEGSTAKTLYSADTFLRDELLGKTWEQLEAKWDSDDDWQDQFAGAVFDLHSYVFGFTSTDRFGNMPATGMLRNLPRATMESYFTPFEETKAAVKREEKELPASSADYNLAEKMKFSFTAEEQAKIPKKEDWFVMPDEGYEIMDEIINSKDLRNYWLIGKAGTGKTELAKQIAANLGIPYVFVNCGSGFDDAKIRGQFIPNPDAAMPVDQKVLDYVNSLTQEDYVRDADVIADKIGAKSSSIPDIVNKITEIKSSGTAKRPEFLWQDSPIVYAYTRPCVCEIQEADCIRDPGVLTNFNSILECGENKFIQLDNGKIIRKNPYCIYIFTSNMQYEGCRMINNAVFDRLDPYRLELPDAKTRATRISKRTGFSDKKTLKKMVSVVDKIDTYMTENGLMTGVCGMRSLEHWAEALLIWQGRHPGEEIPSKVLRDTGARKVLAKTAQPEDELNEIKKIWFGLFGDED